MPFSRLPELSLGTSNISPCVMLALVTYTTSSCDMLYNTYPCTVHQRSSKYFLGGQSVTMVYTSTHHRYKTRGRRTVSGPGFRPNPFALFCGNRAIGCNWQCSRITVMRVLDNEKVSVHVHASVVEEQAVPSGSNE